MNSWIERLLLGKEAQSIARESEAKLKRTEAEFDAARLEFTEIRERLLKSIEHDSRRLIIIMEEK